MNDNSNYLIFGSSSELAQEFLSKLNSKNIYCISTKPDLVSKNYLCITDYLRDIDEILSFCQNISNPTVIFFNGYLHENRPNVKPNKQQIQKTFEINYVVPFELTKCLLSSKLTIKKFIYISSFAAVKLRYKNFNYGSSKKLLELSINSLGLKNYLFVRFGKINTKMSSTHRSTIFDLKKEKAAELLLNKIKNNTGIVYPNLTIRVLATILIMLPNALIKILKF